MWQGVLGVSLAGLGLIMLPVSGTAQIETMNNGGSTATVDLGSSAGMDYWSVDGPGGQNQLPQQWFWYSVNTGSGWSTPQSIENIASQPGGLTYNLSADQSTLNATYQNATLSIGITYQLQGSGVGSESADMLESIGITNNSAGQFNIKFYQYSNFNLLGNNQNSISVIGSPGSYSSIIQTTSVGGNGIEETVDNPLANYAEAGLAGTGTGTVMHDVLSGSPLSGPLAAGPNDVAWAFEWTDAIDSGSSLDIYKDKNLSISPVPEPTTMALIAVGLGAGGLVGRRTWKRGV